MIIVSNQPTDRNVLSSNKTGKEINLIFGIKSLNSPKYYLQLMHWFFLHHYYIFSQNIKLYISKNKTLYMTIRLMIVRNDHSHKTGSVFRSS